MLAELMEMSSESERKPGLAEGLEQVSGVRKSGTLGRPGRQRGGCASGVSVGDVVVVCVVRKGSGSFTSGWHPRPRTCPSLSRGVACGWERHDHIRIWTRIQEWRTKRAWTVFGTSWKFEFVNQV